MKELTEYIEALEALEHVATHGWPRKVDDDGRRVQHGESFVRHDPLAVERLRAEMRLLVGAVARINDWLTTRELEIYGCVPFDDCHRYELSLGRTVGCRNLSANGGCRIGRRELLDKVDG